MSRLLVSFDSLMQTRQTLGRLHDQLLGVGTVLTSAPGSLGGAAIEDELARYGTHWQRDFDAIASRIHGLAGGVGEAALAYQRIERRLQDSGHGGGLPVPPGPAAGQRPPAAGGRERR